MPGEPDDIGALQEELDAARAEWHGATRAYHDTKQALGKSPSPTLSTQLLAAHERVERAGARLALIAGRLAEARRR